MRQLICNFTAFIDWRFGLAMEKNIYYLNDSWKCFFSLCLSNSDHTVYSVWLDFFHEEQSLVLILEFPQPECIVILQTSKVNSNENRSSSHICLV